jgi:hypothetical protein
VSAQCAVAILAVWKLTVSRLYVTGLDKRWCSSAIQRFLEPVSMGQVSPPSLGDTITHPRIPPLNAQSKRMVEREVLARKVTGVIPKRTDVKTGAIRGFSARSFTTDADRAKLLWWQAAIICIPFSWRNGHTVLTLRRL